MATTQIQDALQGEELLAIGPPLLQQTDPSVWLQRLSLFTGRTLSDTALTNEQNYRAGRLTLLGQAVTQGTVQGLALSVDLTAADPVLNLSTGYGISSLGQDVVLTRAMRTTLSGLAVLNGDNGSYIADYAKFTPPAGPWAGVFLLQPVVVDVAGSVVDSGSQNLIVSGNLGASCDQDPSEAAFGDSQIVDAARLVLVTWPANDAALALPAAAPAATWRNRLVYAIFNTELTLDADTYLPWEPYGVPLALAGFDATSKLQFVDRSAVVRAGGLPRRRYLRPFQQNLSAVQPALANARVNQFAEQIGQELTPSSPAGLVANEFASLPPAGLLPSYTMDFVNRKALWCPSNWTVTAAPIFSEELEGAIETAMTAAPLDTTQNENIEILVPLPDAVFDPDILVTEQPSPQFQQELTAATLSRNIVLQHRNVIQQEVNTLAPLVNQPQIDTQAGLTSDELAQIAPSATPVFTPLASEDFGTTLSNGAYTSNDLQQLQQTANAAPYVVSANGASIPFFSTADLADMQTNGIQHFIDTINQRLNQANDLLDLVFLTAQTDIYRYRQNVLNTTDASRLAVSPILANIASGDTAAATAQNIHSYLASIQAPTTTPAPAAPTGAAPAATVAKAAAAPPSSPLLMKADLSIRNTSPAASSTFLNTQKLTTALPVKEISLQSVTAQGVVAKSAPISSFGAAQVSQIPTTPIDITQQSPIVGAQLNLRTLTIAERLAPSASQEAMFYSVGNRVAALQLLADLNLTIDDLPILVDNLPASTTPFVVADMRPGATRQAQLLTLVNNPSIVTPSSLNVNPDESTLFSTGIHVVEQNTQLLRAVEARIQQYQDFLALAAAALVRVENDIAGAQSLLGQLDNDLTQSRQNLSFVGALFADEQTRVANVNAQRAATLGQYVTFVAYIRPRTIIEGEDAPSRQLVPANVASPVPACLKQTVAIPPELSEIVSLLREAPVIWFPPILTLLPKLQRPSLVQNLAVTMQARASLMLKTPAQVSSAESTAGVFAPSIANIFSANQQTMRSFQAVRSSFNPAVLTGQSWSAQIGTIGNIAAIGDLLNSPAVDPQTTNSVARSLQQISSVATCLYTRVCQALPVDRLEWANFLNNGSVSLQNLAVLPGWNTQPYIDRQQMQLLVDWLYQQIDTTNSTSVSLMNDLVATAILLASQAPVDNIVAGAVALRATPVIGNPIRLTLPSDRIAAGMSVQLYSGGDLAARAVVSDLDNSGVNATVTDIYKPNVALEANDAAHFSGLDQNAVVFRAFSS
jgi:hypothetical protein